MVLLRTQLGATDVLYIFLLVWRPRCNMGFPMLLVLEQAAQSSGSVLALVLTTLWLTSKVYGETCLLSIINYTWAGPVNHEHLALTVVSESDLVKSYRLSVCTYSHWSSIFFPINHNSPSYSADYLQTRLKGSFAAKAYLYAMKKVCLPLTKEIYLMFDCRAVMWQEDDGMYLLRRKYVGAIYLGLLYPSIQLHPLSYDKHRSCGLSKACLQCQEPVFVWYGHQHWMPAKKHMCFFALTVRGPIWNTKNECLMWTVSPKRNHFRGSTLKYW